MYGNNPFNGPTQGYGATVNSAVGGYSSQNPSFPVDPVPQQVQPNPQDMYMHGTVQDRNY